MKENKIEKFILIVLAALAITALILFIILSFTEPKSSLNSTTEDPNSNQPIGVIISSESLLEDE